MVKRVRRAVSGQCEVVRICGGANHRGAEAAPVEHTSAMTRALWNEWSTSKKLQPIFVQRAKDPLMDVDSTVALICEAKCITELPVVYVALRLRAMLALASGLTRCPPWYGVHADTCLLFHVSQYRAIAEART